MVAIEAISKMYLEESAQVENWFQRHSLSMILMDNSYNQVNTVTRHSTPMGFLHFKTSTTLWASPM
jgi:hypothetical protein